ncbi:MAG: hypothetical protein Q4F06_10520 [Eubacteriales bacterium]|nr:hypothetical protein [Eubacteriales bacterium]
MVKKKLFRYSSVLMCVVLMMASLTGCGASGAANEVYKNAAISEEAAGNAENVITSAIKNELSVSNTSTLKTNARDEMVYVFDNASGVQNHITVTEKVTDSKGETTTSQTESKQEAPVTMKVTYYMDGVEIKPENMAGKNGKVTIRFEYINNQKKEITVNGKKQTAYVPFTMVTGMMLPTDKFSNVEVTNGKVTKVGDNVVALGITMPGLKDSLNLKFDTETLELDIPEYFEVTADVKDFELDMTMSVATTNIFSSLDIDNMSVDSLKEELDTLQDAANQLTDGTVSLQEGTQQLSDSVPALKDGIEQLNSGAVSLKDGIYAYTDGAATAYDGAVSLNSNMKAYAAAINQLYETLKDKGIDTNVTALSTGAGRLNDGLGTLKTSLENGKTEADTSYQTAYTTFYGAAHTGGLDAALTAKGLTQVPEVTSDTQYVYATGIIANYYSTFKTGMETVIKSKMRTEYIAAYKAQTGVEPAENLINGYISANCTAEYVEGKSLEVLSGLSQAYKAYDICDSTLETLTSAGLFTGASQISSGLASLEKSIGSFNAYQEGTLCSSIYALNINASKLQKEGTEALEAGLATLTENNDKLKSGVVKLAEGTDSLNAGAVTLADGVTQLNAGAITLKDGMAEFNETGIKKITGLVNDDAQTAIDTVKEVVKLGKDYNTFLGRSDGKDNSVTFIYKTAGINK